MIFSPTKKKISESRTLVCNQRKNNQQCGPKQILEDDDILVASQQLAHTQCDQCFDTGHICHPHTMLTCSNWHQDSVAIEKDPLLPTPPLPQNPGKKITFLTIWGTISQLPATRHILITIHPGDPDSRVERGGGGPVSQVVRPGVFVCY